MSVVHNFTSLMMFEILNHFLAVSMFIMKVEV